MTTTDHDEDLLSDSESDEDFSPTTAPEADVSASSSSDDDDENAPTAKQGQKRKRKTAQQQQETDLDAELASGDEATIAAAARRRARKKKQDKKKYKGKAAKEDGEDEDMADWEEDEGGEGGFVKTRSQRRVEQVERKKLASTAGATVDVDELWRQMMEDPFRIPDGASKPDVMESSDKENTAGDGITTSKGTDVVQSKESLATVTAEDDEYITIERSYKFAGETTTESKRVLKSSTEAQLYLTQNKKPPPTASNDTDTAQDSNLDAPGPTKPLVRRPLRRISRFEPNPQGIVKSIPATAQLTWPRGKNTTHLAPAGSVPALPTAATGPKATKLNTVDKSRMDWAGYVDKAGIAEDLDEYGKSKGAYRDRVQFLQRVEGRKDEESRRVRMAGNA